MVIAHRLCFSEGLIPDVHLKRAGDMTSYEYGAGDNDGLVYACCCAPLVHVHVACWQNEHLFVVAMLPLGNNQGTSGRLHQPMR